MKDFSWPGPVFKEVQFKEDQILKEKNNITNLKKHEEQTPPSFNELKNKQQKLDILKSEMQLFNHIPYKGYAKNLVFADGNPDSGLMFIGEAPGEDEDIQGLPFVGKSGQLLSYFLSEIGLTRKDYYITNIINWRPPANRTPTSDEISLMLPFVKKHIEIIEPKLIVLVGSVALKALLPPHKSITAAQSNFFESELGEFYVIYHPSYALRLSTKKKDLWQSILKLKHYISNRDSK